MNSFFDTFRTPLGDFSLLVSETGAVFATAFGGVDSLQARAMGFRATREKRETADARQQVLEYFAGARREFDLRLAPAGTAFQQRVWMALRAIPFGQTRTYAQLAAHIGNPAAARAVGRANATNPICLIVPCHRVIGSDGSLTGFAFGEVIKRRLLEHENVPAFCAA